MYFMMTFRTQSHPIRSIRRIVFSIPVYVVHFHFYITMTLFTFISKKFYRFFNPEFYRSFSSFLLRNCQAFFGAILSSSFFFIWFAFKIFFTCLTYNFFPRFKSKSFTEKRIILIENCLMLQWEGLQITKDI